jgi:hypothetical protein
MSGRARSMVSSLGLIVAVKRQSGTIPDELAVIERVCWGY